MSDSTACQIFVAGYSKHKIQEKNDVKDLFSKFGRIREVSYKGPFSFITFDSEQEAREAVKGMNGQPFHGQKLKVEQVDNRGGGRKRSAATEDECFHCHEKGHWARDCPNRNNNNGTRRRRSRSRSRDRRRRHRSRSSSSRSYSRSPSDRHHRNRRRRSSSSRSHRKRDTRDRRNNRSGYGGQARRHNRSHSSRSKSRASYYSPSKDRGSKSPKKSSI